MAGYIPHPPSPRQQEFLSLTCREGLFGGAAGGGKSDALLMAALQGVHVPGYAALIVRRTFQELSLPDAIMARSHEWLRGTDARWRAEDKTWYFPSTATLTFGYLERDADKYQYQGAAFHFVGVDELTQHLQSTYTYLLGRQRRLKSARIPIRARATTNPGGIGHDWVQARWGIPDAGTRETLVHGDRVFVPSFARDNPGLDVEDYERSLDLLDPVTRDQLKLGLWVKDTTGLVYGYDAALHSVRELPRLQAHERWQHTMGIDYGFRDDTAWAVWAWCETEPCAYLVHVESAAGMTPSDAASRTHALIEQWRPDSIVGDVGGLGKGYVEEARTRFGLPIMPAKKEDKRGYISLFRGALSGGNARVLLPGAEPWAREASGLVWKNEQQRVEHPAQPNHCCDAALYAWREVRTYQTRDKMPPPVTRDPYEAAALEQYRRRTERRNLLGMRAVI